MNTKEIKGFEGKYSIDEDGNVYSLPRQMVRKNGWKMTVRARKLKPAIDGGYLKVAFCVNKKIQSFSVHRLMGMAFFDRDQNSKFEVNHKNGIKTDNRLCNLELVTRSENMLHAFANGLCIAKTGETNGNSKLKEFQVLEIRDKRTKGRTLQSLADEYNVSKKNILDIVKGKIWRSV